MFTNFPPLKDIVRPHPHDVLCGRGGATNNHVGNAHWRQLVADNKPLYLSLPNSQKQLMSKSIVQAIRSQNPPGRFLQKDPETNLWYDVGDARALEKTSQGLREGAPKLRARLKPTQRQESKDDSSNERKNTYKNSRPRKGMVTEKNTQCSAGSDEVVLTKPIQTQNHSLAKCQHGTEETRLGGDSTAASDFPRHRNNKTPGSSDTEFFRMAPTVQNNIMVPSSSLNENRGEIFPNCTNFLIDVVEEEVILQPTPFSAYTIPGIPPQGPVRERRKKSNATVLQQHPTQTHQSLDLLHSSASDSIKQCGDQHHPSSKTADGNLDKLGDSNDSHECIAFSQPSHCIDAPSPPNPVDRGLGNESDGTRTVNGHVQASVNVEELDAIAPIDRCLEQCKDLSFGTVMSVDDKVPSIQPPSELQQKEFSLGSLELTEQEFKLLSNPKAELGHRASEGLHSKRDGTKLHNSNSSSTFEEPEPDRNDPVPTSILFDEAQESPAPVDLGLEPAGFSAGSMMTLDTIASAHKLENAGFSFGSVMSFSTGVGGVTPMPQTLENGPLSFGSVMSSSTVASNLFPAAGTVDGGLRDIETSFGSMAIGTTSVQNHASAPNTSGVSPIPQQTSEPVSTPSFVVMASNQTRSKGNLLDCSDTESEDDYEMKAKKSQNWEKLKEMFESNQLQNNFSLNMPGIATAPMTSSRQSSATTLRSNVPSKSFEPDTFQVSTSLPYSGRNEESCSIEPSQSRNTMKLDTDCADENEDWKAFESLMLNRGDSLASERFQCDPQYD